jgi:type IV secretion system protein VirB10
MDGRASEDFDRSEGKIRSEGNKSGDARSIGEAAAAGASVGVIAGGINDHYGMGAGIGAAAGATAGLVGVLLSRGPEAVLAKGSTIEMVLDRQLFFEVEDLNFGPIQQPRIEGGPAPSSHGTSSAPLPGRRSPF